MLHKGIKKLKQTKGLFRNLCDSLAVGDNGGSCILPISSYIGQYQLSHQDASVEKTGEDNPGRGRVACCGQAGKAASPSEVGGARRRAEGRGSVCAERQVVSPLGICLLGWKTSGDTDLPLVSVWL